MSASDSATPYTAVVHFHGMGSQRRYEEISGLVDSVNEYLMGAGEGTLTEIEPRQERHRFDPSRLVTYIRTRFLPKTGEGMREVRFYEVYWAPIMANPSSAWTVFWWILRQAVRPLTSLVTPWSREKRLRRSRLGLLWERFQRDKKKGKGWTKGYSDADFDCLLEAFTAFGEDPAFANARLPRFCAYLHETRDDPAQARRCAQLARRWRRIDRGEELQHLAVLVTILLGIALVTGFLAWSLIRLAGWLTHGEIIPEALRGSILGWFDLIPGQSGLGWQAALGLVGSLTVGGVLKSFLRDRMGDVEAWTTYEETDEKHRKRAKVIETGEDMLRHVLQKDPSAPDEDGTGLCTRVVLVSHSLGTCVAQDTLLSLMHENRAAPGDEGDPIDAFHRLDKLSHFVTAGSPIDKVNYFFESKLDTGFQHRRIVDHLRGDISTEPFTRNRKPQVHWVNFWDLADIIGGPLQSPMGKDDLSNTVDNFQVANLRLPDPAAAHNGYWHNRTVMKHLFEMIYLGLYDYRDTEATLVRDASGKVTGQDYLPLKIGDSARALRAGDAGREAAHAPGFARAVALTRLVQTLALALPWIYLGVLCWWYFWPTALSERVFASLAIATIGIVALAALGALAGLVRKLMGHKPGRARLPLNPPAR